jgi:hypothetical protein
VDIFLMQTDGRMIYDLEPPDRPERLFRSPVQAFPQLVALAGRVAAEREERGTIPFPCRAWRRGGQVAFWRTLALYDSSALRHHLRQEALEK